MYYHVYIHSHIVFLIKKYISANLPCSFFFVSDTLKRTITEHIKSESFRHFSTFPTKHIITL